MDTRKSWLTLGLVPGLLAVAIGLPFIVYWGELPSPMATHWGLGGSPDGSMVPALILALLGGVFVAVWVAFVRMTNRVPGEFPSFLAVLYGIGGLLAAVSWLSVLANRGVTDWSNADEVGVLQMALVIGAGGLAGAAGWLLGGGSDAMQPAASTPALIGVEPRHAVWSGRGSGWVLTGLGVVVIVIGLATWSLVTVLLVLIGVLMLMFAEVRVTVSSGGVFVSHGWFGFPTWTVPFAEITEARVEEVRPMAYGGWGYRVRPGVRAVLTRGGDGLYLVRPNKPDLVLTVDDAATGAGLVNSMLGVERKQI